jgi:RNA polymerase sigma-54 factor
LNVRTVLKEIIDNESRPYSDSDLVELLSKRGFDVARRTVAKYRSIEGILPAHLRKAVAQNP